MNTRITASRLMQLGSATLVVALAAPACSSFLTKDAASSYLVINSLGASTGREPDKVVGALDSDVLTYVKKDDGSGKQVLVPTIFEDNLVATFSLGMKNPGSVETPNAPSTNNFITVQRYHVQFIRSDGRNTEGVDVPYAFDGAITLTVGGDAVKTAMILVRVQSKSEAPLKAFVGKVGALSTIAEITFYGKDQTGREVTVVGRISVNFADWGDPA